MYGGAGAPDGGVGSASVGAAGTATVEAKRFAIPFGASKSMAKPCATAEAARSVRTIFMLDEGERRVLTGLTNSKDGTKRKGMEDQLRKKRTYRSVRN
jgi:hypothetical protein